MLVGERLKLDAGCCYVESGVVSSRPGLFLRALAAGRPLDGWYGDATSRVKMAIRMPGQQLPTTPQALMLGSARFGRFECVAWPLRCDGLSAERG